MSIWQLLSILKKNWISISIIIIVILITGGGYSLMSEGNLANSYYFNEIVIYDDWNYYPLGFIHTYIQSLNKFLKEEDLMSSISNVTLIDSDLKDQKDEYNLRVMFSSGVEKSNAELISSKIVNWHNTTINNEVEVLRAYKEQEITNLYLEYENAEIKYHSFLNIADLSIVENMVLESTLKSKKDIAFEMWKTYKVDFVSLNDELLNVGNFNIGCFKIINRSSSIKSKPFYIDIIITLIIGFVLAIIFVLLRQSYLEYKSSKNK